MSNLIVIAKVTAKEEHIEDVKAALLGLIEPTLKEEGCIQYDCHQGTEDSHVFHFYEVWQSGDHLKAHGASEHIQSMRGQIENWVVGRELSLMKKL